MKQHITVEQLNELSNEQKDKLFRWMYSVKMETPCIAMSIGQMIEFLYDKGERPDIHAPSLFDKTLSGWWVETMSITTPSDSKLELCDILWSVVKECL